MSADAYPRFHQRVAEAMEARYGQAARAPHDWREIQAWHFEQAGIIDRAIACVLEVAEAKVARLEFASGRRWAEQAIALAERLEPADLALYELRISALALAVLDFGGQFREGLEFARRMLHAAQERDDLEAEARALLALGRMQRELGQLTEAKQSLTRALELIGAEDDSGVGADIRLHLAKVHLLQGKHIEALHELQAAREDQEQRDDWLQLARVLTNIGDVYRVLGFSREGFAFYTRALTLEQGRGNLVGQSMLRDKLGLALLDRGELDDALASAEEGLQIRERLGDEVGQARSLANIGMIQLRRDRADLALRLYERAYAIELRIQHPRGQSVALQHIGDAQRALSRADDADESYTRALGIARSLSDSVGEARIYEKIGDLCQDRGSTARATEMFCAALTIREALHHADEAAALRRKL